MESGLRQKYMTSNGTSPGVIKYYPYGYCRNSTGDLGTDRLFMGQRLDILENNFIRSTGDIY